MANGKTFDQFLGNEGFEEGIMMDFDEFLHQSFGKRASQNLRLEGTT